MAHIVLSRQSDYARKVTNDAPSETAHALTQPSPSQAVIALVDDDRNILTSVSIALQAEGFATRVYSEGEAALKALLENPPHLAIHHCLHGA